ncbi:hypothetical protein BC941DRAFT_385045 [Chlamydoabsidia padenii]|nr:hypothetical protein BC941DRAFT_385045 [Chlamydoabsidia padenii]
MDTNLTCSPRVSSPLRQQRRDTDDFTPSLRQQNSRSCIVADNNQQQVETDISDSPVMADYAIRKHHSTSTLTRDLQRWQQLGCRLELSDTSNNSSIIEEEECTISSPVESLPDHITTQRPNNIKDTSTLGQDITENDAMDVLILDPDELVRFRKWMVGFAIVKFDLEIGQALDYVYPPMELESTVQKNICFSAFPDSNVFEVGDQVFNIRLRANNSLFAASGPTTTAGFLYGHVFFRQKKDPSIRRGYFQKSLVLLSQHPFVGLFSRIVAILGPAFFDAGQPMLEAAVMNIANWLEPRMDGRILDLPFLGHLLEVQLAHPRQPQLLETSTFDMNRLQPDLHIMASVPTTGLYSHFRDIIKDLWLLWELILLGEPIVVIAPNPGICSDSIVSLVDLINPIPYCGDYRPYFTIQDSDFKSFVNKNQPPSNLILGVTNPFFNTAIGHWPHIARVGRQQHWKPDGTLITTQSDNHSTNKNHLRLATRSPKPNVGSHRHYDFIQGVKSKRKGVVAKDMGLLRMMTEATIRGHPPDWLLDNILRHHFIDLTEKFLLPLNRYFKTLIPNEKTPLEPDMKLPQLRPFQTDQFMKSLKEHGSPLPFKSTFKTRTSTSDPAKELYGQFLKCGNFATWLQQSTTVAQHDIDKHYLAQLCHVDPKKNLSGETTQLIRDLLDDSTSSVSNLTSILTDHQREQLQLIMKSVTLRD